MFDRPVERDCVSKRITSSPSVELADIVNCFYPLKAGPPFSWRAAVLDSPLGPGSLIRYSTPKKEESLFHTRLFPHVFPAFPALWHIFSPHFSLTCGAAIRAKRRVVTTQHRQNLHSARVAAAKKGENRKISLV